MLYLCTRYIQESDLWYDCQFGAQIRESVSADGDAVHLHVSAGCLDDAEQSQSEGRLACPSAANNTNLQRVR